MRFSIGVRLGPFGGCVWNERLGRERSDPRADWAGPIVPAGRQRVQLDPRRGPVHPGRSGRAIFFQQPATSATRVALVAGPSTPGRSGGAHPFRVQLESRSSRARPPRTFSRRGPSLQQPATSATRVALVAGPSTTDLLAGPYSSSSRQRVQLESRSSRARPPRTFWRGPFFQQPATSATRVALVACPNHPRPRLAHMPGRPRPRLSMCTCLPGGPRRTSPPRSSERPATVGRLGHQSLASGLLPRLESQTVWYWR